VQTGTFLIRATVDNPSGVLRPNQYVRARLKGAIRPNAISIPQRAIQQGGKGHFVWVVNKQDQAELRPIAVADWDGDDWFVTDGLDAGDRVVVDGGQRLAAGVKVTATAYVPPKTTATPASPLQGSGARTPTHALSDIAVFFASGSAALDDAAKGVVRMKAAEVMGIGTPITITGYADRTGNAQANVELAKRRAAAVREALVNLGVATERIRMVPPVSVTGDSDDSRARRVDSLVAQ
jgi:membrane fusion protein (multidrug efflux system)